MPTVALQPASQVVWPKDGCAALVVVDVVLGDRVVDFADVFVAVAVAVAVAVVEWEEVPVGAILEVMEVGWKTARFTSSRWCTYTMLATGEMNA